MSVWKKTMLYLGLGPDGEYESAPPPIGMHPDPTMAPPPGLAPVPAAAPAGATMVDVAEPGGGGAIRPLGAVDSPEGDPVGLKPMPVGAVSSGVDMRPVGVTATAPASSGGQRINTVRPIPAGSAALARPRVLTPGVFNDAQEIGDIFRGQRAVVVNLQEANRELSRRLIDFASGLCYGLQGQMEKIADRVYLLIPAGVELSPEDRIDLREQGLLDA